MPHPGPAGLLAFPILLLAGGATLVGGAGPAGGRADGRVELEVAGILPVPDGPAAIVVLKEKATGTILPIVVPGGRDLREPAPPRGGEGPLAGRVIGALGARVSEVMIDRAEESRSGARVKLSRGAQTLELRARPSEGIALAVAAHVPILTTRRLLRQAGLTPDELSRARTKARANELRL